MSKGIIYVMQVGNKGMVKLEQMTISQFDNYAKQFADGGRSGYEVLKQDFVLQAFVVEDCENVLKMLKVLIGKYRIGTSDCYRYKFKNAKQLILGLQGETYCTESKIEEEYVSPRKNEGIVKPQKTIRAISERNYRDRDDWYLPNGIYYISSESRKYNMEIRAALEKVGNHRYFLKEGSTCLGVTAKERTKGIKVVANILQEDFFFKSVSGAATLVRGTQSDGWVTWKNKDGKIIDIYRPKDEKKPAL